MEMITPGFGNLWTWILVFFGGCMAYQPLKTVEINPAKTEVAEAIEENNGVVLDIRHDRINFSYRDNNGQLLQESCKNDSASVSHMIQRQIEKAGGRDNLKIVVRGPENLSWENFQSVIAALAARKVYHYKLITTPD
jgi:hypothetical protein